VFGRGALLRPDWSQFSVVEEQHGLPTGTIQELYNKNPKSAVRKVLAGESVSGENAWKQQAALGTEMRGLQLEFCPDLECKVSRALQDMWRKVRINGDARDALQCLRFDGFKTALVTPSWNDLDVGSVRDGKAKSEIARHFNVIVETNEEGFPHPSEGPGAHSAACERMGLREAEVIYVDVSERAGRLASAAGMRALVAPSPVALVRLLEDALDLPLANFAWTRDQYAKVLWGGAKECEPLARMPANASA
jgi:beta-phosphoglucomutase-like phosphatase (HAD superfamily)